MLANLIKDIQIIANTTLEFGVSRMGSLHYASCIHSGKNKDETISFTTYCGVDDKPQTAVLKSLMEFCERYVQKTETLKGKRAHDPFNHCSDGFAAYPKHLANSAHHARDNAYNEALERHIWASWWDHETAHQYQKFSKADFAQIDKDRILEELAEHLPLEYIYQVSPITLQSSKSVILYFCKIKNAGFISGGAAGEAMHQDKISRRALSELFRHGLAYSRLKNRTPMNFYEQKINHWGKGHTNANLVSKIENTQSTKIITLPELALDETIESPLSPLIQVHRCLFKNQADFLNRDMTRLCL
jgi:hypothetical protein